jgi:fatty acid desaturase
MFITNHGSGNDSTNDNNSCIPSKSTYAGPLYSIFTLGTNYHCEHHDFPTIPFHQLSKLQQIAPEFYHPSTNDIRKKERRDNLFQIMKQTFAYPEFYAFMNSNIVINKK